MSILSSLNREQKESVGILSLGTFLEYFDLMLYVHMAVLLNEIFFPQADPQKASLFTALALCSSLAFRPIGAVIFGWIGDRKGRRPTIIITTAMMAVSCIAIMLLPTYAQIGLAAAWLVTFIRIFQGLSSMGEVVGAWIYLTETIERPARFPAVAFINTAEGLGSVAALGVAFLVISYGWNWRYAFLIGALIAGISIFARRRLRETPEFLETKRKWMKKVAFQTNVDVDPVEGAAFNATWKEKINKKTLLSYFGIACGWPLCFYLAFFYPVTLLQGKFHYGVEDIIKHNFFLAFVPSVTCMVLAYLSYRIHPLKIQKVKATLALLLFILLPYLMNAAATPEQLFLIQALLCIFRLDDTPSTPIFLNHFPIYCRFMCATVLFSLSRALIYAITSFGMYFLTSYFEFFGIWIVALPIVIAYICGLKHFEDLERKLGLYPNVDRPLLFGGKDPALFASKATQFD